MSTTNFKKITIKEKIGSRGGGVEISLDTLGFPKGKMTAYQNYLGGGMLGRVENGCNILNWRGYDKLMEIAKELAEYYHNLTNPESESIDFAENQKLPLSAY